jgi:ubiquinone/menaquinone biosynthesis C-methylase UbiE
MFKIKGDVKELRNFADESFDVILCHNVLEYATEREEILKHNKPGRVMQMLEIELKVSEIEEYKAIASFHHVIFRKK